jgi:hypothetical protein
VCPRDAALVTPVKEVKGGRGAKFIESEGRKKDKRVSRIVVVCQGKTTHQACS